MKSIFPIFSNNILFLGQKQQAWYWFFKKVGITVFFGFYSISKTVILFSRKQFLLVQNRHQQDDTIHFGAVTNPQQPMGGNMVSHGKWALWTLLLRMDRAKFLHHSRPSPPNELFMNPEWYWCCCQKQ